MDRSVAPVAPVGLAAAVRAAGLRLAGPLGTTGVEPRWSAVDQDGARWVLTVVPAVDAGRARDRVLALDALGHPHLARLGPLVALPDGGLVVAHEVVPGLDLAALVAARGTLRPGEVAAIVGPVARALVAVHAAGLVHGDVSPRNIVLGADRVVLVDLVHGSDPTERGTPGFAAPERVAVAAAAGDVYALGRVGLVLLGLQRVAADDGQDALVAALRRAADREPARRGSSADLAEAVEATGSTEAVPLPDPAVLARIALRRLAEPRRPARSGSSAGARGETTRRRAARGRHRRRRLGARVAWSAGAVAVGLAVGGALTLTAQADRVSPVGGAGPLATAARVTAVRTAALASLDPRALAAVTVPGSPAARADQSLLIALRRAGRAPTVEQLAVLVRPGEQGVVTGSWVRTADGVGFSQVELVLGPGPAGRRVAEVRPVVP